MSPSVVRNFAWIAEQELAGAVSAKCTAATRDFLAEFPHSSQQFYRLVYNQRPDLDDILWNAIRAGKIRGFALANMEIGGGIMDDSEIVVKVTETFASSTLLRRNLPGSTVSRGWSPVIQAVDDFSKLKLKRATPW